MFPEQEKKKRKKAVLSVKTCKAQAVEAVKTALSRASKVLFHLSSISNHNVGALRQKHICNSSPCPNFPFGEESNVDYAAIEDHQTAAVAEQCANPLLRDGIVPLHTIGNMENVF